MSTTTHYNLPTLQSTQGDIGACLEDLLVEDSGNSGMEIIDETLYTHDQNINTLKGVVETFSVSSWTADNTIAPFTYKATVTLITTLSAQSIVELLNDDAILFATYGFSIGDITNQVVTIYSIGQPSAAVTISIRIGGVLSNSGGGGGGTTLNKYTVTNKSASVVNSILRGAKGKVLVDGEFNLTGALSSTLTGVPVLFADNYTYENMHFHFQAIAPINDTTYLIFGRFYFRGGSILSPTVYAIDSSTGAVVVPTLQVQWTSFKITYYNDVEITQ